MVIDIVLLSIAFIGLVIGTVTDFRTREVPDWLNYSLIFSGIGLRLIYSSITFDWMYLLYGIVGLAAFMGLGYLMFYTAQWGGGDSKMMMGLGALIGVEFTLQPVPLMLVFLLNVLFVGALYGIIYSVVLALQNRKGFARSFKKIMHSDKVRRFRKIKLAVLLVLMVAILFFLRNKTVDIVALTLLVGTVIIAYLSLYLVIFVKAVESSAMLKSINPDKLTEGDWIAKDVFVKGKKITGPKDLGVSKKQIKQLIAFKKSGKIDKVMVKYGIPFVPSFLFAFILSLMFGAWWLFLI